MIKSTEGPAAPDRTHFGACSGVAAWRSPVTIEDGTEALRIALAATRAYRTGQPVSVAAVTQDDT